MARSVINHLAPCYQSSQQDLRQFNRRDSLPGAVRFSGSTSVQVGIMADGRTYRRNTLFGPERLRARAIDRDRRRDAEFNHCAQPSNFNLDGASSLSSATMPCQPAQTGRTHRCTRPVRIAVDIPCTAKAANTWLNGQIIAHYGGAKAVHSIRSRTMFGRTAPRHCSNIALAVSTVQLR